jgi:hypothetical protein
MERKKTYFTSDIHLGAYLYAQGQELLGLEREGRRAVFLFSDSKRCKELTLDFFNGRATCDVREYVRALQELKSTIFNL